MRHRALLVLCVPPRYSFTAAAPRLSLTCRGGEETSVAPAQEEKVQPAGPGVHSSGCGAELSSPVCSQGTGAQGIPRGGCWVSPESSWCCCRAGNPKPSGECRALHPFHSMDNNVQAHVPVWQSSWAQRLLSLRHTCECPAESGLGGQHIPESQIPLCSAWIPFVPALPCIHWYFCKDFIPDGRCQPMSFACERSRGAVVRFWCSLHVLSVLVPTSPVSAVFSSTPSLIGFH